MSEHGKFALLLVLGFYAQDLRADLVPRPFVQVMCEEAELIVEGLCVGGDRVAVGRVWKAPAGFAETTLTIEHLPEYEKSLGANRKFPEQVDADGIVLFLSRHVEGWTPIHECKQERGYAAPGLFWFDERHCYGFGDGLFGGYALARGHRGDESFRVPETIDALTTEIEQGLRMAREWREIRDQPPHVRAAVLAKYLSPRTRPAGYRAYGDRIVLPRVLDAGDYGIAALVAVLDNAEPGDCLNEALWILHEFHADAQPAIPAMLRLFDHPGKTSTGAIFSALRSTGDPVVVPALRKGLSDPDRKVACYAAQGLGEFGDRESFAKIAALLPNPAEEKDDHLVLGLLTSLKQLDPTRARPLIERAANDPLMHNIHGQLQKRR